MPRRVSYTLKKKQIIIKVNQIMDTRDVINSLKKKLPELQEMYKELEPTILVTGKHFKDKEKIELQKLFSKYFDTDIRFDCPNKLGLYGIRKTFKKEIATSKTKFFRTSLRSGQKVEFEGSVVILGDVNHGAEVIAGENIVILGSLRGMAHAGAMGNKEAIITAESIEATQLRISNVIRECEREEFLNSVLKTNAYLNEENKIIIE